MIIAIAMPIEKHQDIFVENFTPHRYCGNTFFTFGVAYIKPAYTEPTTGEHDFNTCDDCQKSLKVISEQIESRFAAFPDCCEHHKELKKEGWFVKDDYKDISKQVSTKVIYTRQHILNNIAIENWYQDITNYIEYTIHSFGQFKYLPGLYLEDYNQYIKHFLAVNKDLFTRSKTEQLIGYLVKRETKEKANNTDLNVLLSAYEKWVNLFPFDISFFQGLKEHYKQTLPILTGKPEYNPYLKMSKSAMHTKDSLLAMLLKLTNELLVTVNTYMLNEKGLLKDTDKIRLEIAFAERKNKLDIGYINNSVDENTKFRKILKAWFRDEKKFIDDISQSLKAKSDEPKPEMSKVTILRIEFEKLGFTTLPLIKDKLTEKNIERLFELIGKNKTPYQIAMLHYLGFLALLFDANSKEKSYRILATILNAKHRVIKGNCLVLSSRSDENRKTYTSHLHSIEAEKDYQNIKLG